jgi:ribokinase
MTATRVLVVGSINCDVTVRVADLPSPGANGEVTPEQVEAAFDSSNRPAAVLIQLEIPLATVAATLRLARAHSVTTILNPAPANLEILRLLPLVDILTPNEHELAELTGMSFAEISDGGSMFAQALIRLQAISGGIVLATRGAEGSAAYDGSSFLRIPAYNMTAVDTTGAGDVFNGALAASIASGAALASAMRKASAAAAISVTRPSAEKSAPTLSEVEALMSKQGAWAEGHVRTALQL